MNENLNLVEILKDVPEGTELYSPLAGTVTLQEIVPITDYPIHYPILVECSQKGILGFAKNGCYFLGYDDAECLLFPSKEQRDWSKFVPPLKDGAPVMATDWGKPFGLRYYSTIEKNSTYKNGERDGDTTTWDIIIPFDKFDPNNIEESLKYNIVK